MSQAYFEIAPLFEKQWTGIPIVTAELATRALNDATLEWTFLYEDILIEKEITEDILSRRSGGAYLSYLEKRLWAQNILSPNEIRNGICIFPNVKALRNRFKKEAMIVHDLSTLLTPEFHNLDTINHHANRIRGDIASSDHLFCVSQATLGDVSSYFGVDKSKLSVLPLGMTIDPCLLHRVSSTRATDQMKQQYVCVLGTIEPRKNGGIVLELLKEFPEILKRYKIIFVGRDGWRDQKNVLLSELKSINADVDRIIFTGFVSEEEKLRLILESRFCIYPSFFEGFGIPVLEAAVLGKFIVCSNTTSLPEVAPDMCFFFAPTDVTSLADAFRKAEKATQLSRLSSLSFHDLWLRCSARDWTQGYDMLRQWIMSEA